MAPARGNRPSGATAANLPQTSASLPTHQSLVGPLNDKAQQALRNLPRNHKLDTLKTRLQTANEYMTQAAADVNDRFQVKVAAHQKKRARLAAQGALDDAAEDDRAIDEMRQATDEMTGKLDFAVRHVIDIGEDVKCTEAALQELDTNIRGDGRRPPQTQSTLGASQFRSQRLGAGEGDDSENPESEEGSAPISALQALKDKIGGQAAVYGSLSKTQRYASHNDYVAFRKIVHDAHYPEEQAPPLAHPSSWFAGEDGGAQASSQSAGRGSQAVEDDDDVAVERERISVKCPITLTEMKDPVSSTKCPHNYERAAISAMIDSSEVRVGGDGRRNRGQNAMRCPVPGCDAMLTSDDLQTNPILVRKIKRIQAALNARNDEYDDDDTRIGHRDTLDQRSRDIITSSPAPAPSSRLKLERRSQVTRPVSMVPNTQTNEDSEMMDDSRDSSDVDEESEEDEDEGEEDSEML